MASKYGSRRKPSSTKGFLIAALASFLAGGALAGYVVYYNLNSDDEAPLSPAAARRNCPTSRW